MQKNIFVLCSLFAILFAIGISSVESRRCKCHKGWYKKYNHHNKNNHGVATSTPSWYQLADYDCSNVNGVLIATYFNIKTGDDYSDNCLLVCLDNSDCSFFVWTEATKVCNIYSGSIFNSDRELSRGCKNSRSGVYSGWVIERTVFGQPETTSKSTSKVTTTTIAAITTTTTTTTTTTIATSTIPATTPPWYQWLGYDCSSAGGSLISTFNNVTTGVYTSGNCFLKCYFNTNCWYFVWNINSN